MSEPTALELAGLRLLLFVGVALVQPERKDDFLPLATLLALKNEDMLADELSDCENPVIRDMRRD